MFLEEERKSFIDDYRLTACMNVLKWFVTNLSEQVGNMFIQEHACKMMSFKHFDPIIVIIVVIMATMVPVHYSYPHDRHGGGHTAV